MIFVSLNYKNIDLLSVLFCLQLFLVFNLVARQFFSCFNWNPHKNRNKKILEILEVKDREEEVNENEGNNVDVE